MSQVRGQVQNCLSNEFCEFSRIRHRRVFVAKVSTPALPHERIPLQVSMSSTADQRDSNIVRKLVGIGAALVLVFVATTLVWQAGKAPRTGIQLPILEVIALYFFASLLWLWGISVALQTKTVEAGRRVLRVIVIVALVCRAAQIFGSPILEIDYYRYMWDGMVVNNGVSPWLYSPSQVLAEEGGIDDPRLDRLQRLAVSTLSVRTIVSRVHYEEYTTIYPPVSQAVFAAAMWLVPDGASVNVHRWCLKTVLVLFDLATLFVVVALLRTLNIRSGWAAAYAWSPLVIKEISNSGHLDSIATFFTTAAVLSFAKWMQSSTNSDSHPRDEHSPIPFALSAISIAMGIASKIFPVILCPLFVVAATRRSIRHAVVWLIVCVASTFVLMSPMLLRMNSVVSLADADGIASTHGAKEGLSSFLARWRMNDVIFTVCMENARPARERNVNQPWYVFVPNSVRLRLDRVIREAGFSNFPSFFVARILTGGVFCVVYLTVVWCIVKEGYGKGASASAHRFVQHVFAIIASFFFLQPTQNPWYWVWAMPFVALARNRGWLIVPACLFVYYSRFWFRYHSVSLKFAGHSYFGTGCFDNCVVFFEFLPVVLALTIWPVVRKSFQAK